MAQDVFSYLEKDYRYLNNYIKDFNESLFTSPHSSIIKGRIFVERLTHEVIILEKYNLAEFPNQVDKIRKLRADGVFVEEIYRSFDMVRLLGNKAAHSEVEGDLEAALNVHKNIYKIACWFVGTYIDYKFEAEPYKTPMPTVNKEGNNSELISELMNKVENLINAQEVNTNVIIEKEEKSKNTSFNNEDAKDALEDLLIEGVFDDEVDKKCLVQGLSKLKESSKEAVESLSEFTKFKRYMHIERDAQRNLEELIIKANESNKAQLILVCGSVGDGKSHIISYFINKYPFIKENFTLHNDATESLEPNKTSMDTLNEILDEFSDEKIEQSNQKFILAINLGTLNNFIDSKYGERFTKLVKYVQDNNLLETSVEDSSFNENSIFQHVDFNDYHIFTLKDGKVRSEYVKSLIRKITEPSELNYFYGEYKRNCIVCPNKDSCPIKANYELLSKDNVQDAVIDLLVQSIVKNKIIISTRALLNFIYELIIPRSYIDVNSPTFKNKISKLNNQDYIKSLLPNIIFEHKELSFIFEALSTIDPLNVRNEKVDDFIIDFNNTIDIMTYFKEYIDYSKGYLDRLNSINFGETEDRKIRFELLKLFIRSYYICGKEELFSLRDTVYDEYMNAVFCWNRGDKSKLRNVYDNVKNGIIKWNGEADKDQINLFVGKNQVKYKVSEKIKLKADPSNLPNSDEDDLKKFIGTLNLKYRNENENKSYKIEIDYGLYKLLVQVNNGYRPNKKDKNHFIKFIEFINKLEETGSQREELIFTEKNREENKKFKLEYDEEFEEYRFMEI